ncbi:hypothetical protein PAMP_006049 [Pampus punctatissimus]
MGAILVDGAVDKLSGAEKNWEPVESSSARSSLPCGISVSSHTQTPVCPYYLPWKAPVPRPPLLSPTHSTPC